MPGDQAAGDAMSTPAREAGASGPAMPPLAAGDPSAASRAAPSAGAAPPPPDAVPTAGDEARALAAARAARERAYAPYSRFRVGAAALDATGALVAGANVENASYGLTACAERVALWTAVAAGAAPIRLLALVTDTPRPVSPCGACRQVLAELAPDAVVLMATLDGEAQRSTVRELLPGAFGAGDLTP